MVFSEQNNIVFLRLNGQNAKFFFVKAVGSNKCRNHFAEYIYMLFVLVRIKRKTLTHDMYVVGSKSSRPDQLFKVTEIKQLCYFST